MHKSGWVHRDISAGNILLLKVGDSLQDKIADLEYAKRYSQPTLSTREVRAVNHLLTLHSFYLAKTLFAGHARLHGSRGL